MRRLQSVLLAGFIGALSIVGLANPSAATPTQISKTSLVTQIAALPPILVAGSSGTADILRSGAQIVHVNGIPLGVVVRGQFGSKTTMFGTSMTTMGATVTVITGMGCKNIGGPAHDGCGGGLSVPITDPAAAPISGLLFTEENGAGGFTAMNGLAGGFGGKMPVLGVNKVCLFKACSLGPAANLSVPIANVGTGGSTAVSGSVSLTVQGAPWTTGMVVFFPRTAMTAMGKAVNPPGNATGMGMTTMGGTSMATAFVTGGINTKTKTRTAMGATGTMSTRVKTSMGADGTHIQLVTPIFISTSLGPPNAVVPGATFFSFVVPAVPEPGVAAVFGAAIGTLVLMGWRRRRH
jgi:hypothetical protein